MALTSAIFIIVRFYYRYKFTLLPTLKTLKHKQIIIDNPSSINYNTLVTWFEEIVKFDFFQIMTLVRVIRSDFFVLSQIKTPICLIR